MGFHPKNSSWSTMVSRSLYIGLVLCTVQALFEPIAKMASTENHSGATGPVSRIRETASRYGNLPLGFVENKGQAESSIRFVGRSNGTSLALRDDALEIHVSNGQRNRTASAIPPRSILRMTLLGASHLSKWQARDELPGKTNYIFGRDASKWLLDLPTFATISRPNVYPGIDQVFYGTLSQLEYDFVVAPGVDPGVIRMKFEGAGRPRLDSNGNLILKTGIGELVQRKPVIYQDTATGRSEVPGEFLVIGNRAVGFKIGAYDRNLPLTIDPVLVYSTYLGGANDDTGSSIAVDAAGNAYVAGTTNSSNFPLTGPLQGANAGTSDAFVTKVNAAGTAIVYSTYIGGAVADRADGIAVDSGGNAYVVGRTNSLDFPTTTGALAPTYRGGDFDAFVSKLSPQGNGLVYSTYLGGADNDSAVGVSVDSAGSAYVTGGTRSFDFPTTQNAYLPSTGGSTDAFLTKLNPAGSALVYSSFLGGGSTDRGSAVAVDNSGKAVVAGLTGSQDFPTQNAFQNDPAGGFDAFAAKFDTNASGTASLLYCTYLGGAGDDRAFGVALDTAGSTYLTGQTTSNNFPVAGAVQSTFGGMVDAFITKLDATGQRVYSTYLGGSGDDRATAIAVSSAKDVYLTGFTTSTNFPVLNAIQATNGGGTDLFVSHLNAAGNGLVYSTYLGGSGDEDLTTNVTFSGGIALDASNNAYVTGFTSSTNFPTVAPLRGTNAGKLDVLIAKISDIPAGSDFAVSITPATRTVNPGGTAAFNVTVTPTGGFTGNVNLSVAGLPGSSTASFNPTTINVSSSTSQSSVLTVVTTASTPTGTFPLSVTGASGAVQHSATTSLVVTNSPLADLVINNTASPSPVNVTTTLSYRLAVTNNGPAQASNVSVTDNVPASATFQSATPSQGTCSGGSALTCSLGALAAGATATVTVVVTPTNTGQLTNTATVNATETDPEQSNNSASSAVTVQSQGTGPTMLDPNLKVRTVVSGLSNPVSMAFIGQNDFLVLEKASGKVQRVTNGSLQGTVLDLPVNSFSERGLLGIVLHPAFQQNGYVFLYWTESSTGADSLNADEVPLFGNRVDRYFWNGSSLTLDRNLIKLRALQQDSGQPSRGNHNGGVLRFGPDGKLYILIGDEGRRGFLQNVTNGGTVPDDQFGGPEPDNAHLTGVILRLNDDGTTPLDNPFQSAVTSLSGEAGANVKKVFAYGIRNSFGFDFDPLTGGLWEQENGDNSFDEINHIQAGSNGGWIQVMGPANRINDYKAIETTRNGLQQIRWPATNIAATSQAAMSRLYNLPGSHYTDPEFSWKYAVAPAGLGFVRGRSLGPQYEGDLFVGASRTTLVGGYLFRLRFTQDRSHLSFSDPRLADGVADNADKFDVLESESLMVGRDFGVTTNIITGPNGNLFAVSLTDGAVYEVSAVQPKLFVADLTGAQETPANGSKGTGVATLLLNPGETTAAVSLNFSGLSSAETAAHIHGPAPEGTAAPVLFPLPQGNFTDFQINLTPPQVQDLKNGLLYINIHSTNFPAGEIRGQLRAGSALKSVQFDSPGYSVNEENLTATITVTRIGDSSGSTTVDYASSDGTASARSDYHPVSGRLTFAPGETSKSINVSIVDDAYVEGNENLTLRLSNPTGGAVLASPSSANLTIVDNDAGTPTSNPINDSRVFVRQHYLDFLDREPDQGGWDYWTSEITKCGANAACIDDRRISVSAAFFIEQEFQNTGFYVYRVRHASLGTQSNLAQYVNDRGLIGSGTAAEKIVFTDAWVQQPEFLAKYPVALTGPQFVDALLATVKQGSSVDLASQRDALVADYSANGSRSRIVRAVVENAAFVAVEYNPAFVLSQYFGYLRRDPEPGGYLFWLDVLNNKQPNNFRGMVCSFLTSTEYQERFSPVVTRSNRDCAAVR